jgi:hypothetical protein
LLSIEIGINGDIKQWKVKEASPFAALYISLIPALLLGSKIDDRREMQAVEEVTS